MSASFRTIFLVIIATIFFSNIIKAQPRKGEFVEASIGFGVSVPDEDIEIYGSGFYAQGEYVIGLTKWFGLRPYAGIILTSPDKNTTQPSFSEYKVTSKAFLFGGKARICAPIPWVAPYFELGIGASIGSFETYTPISNIKKDGLLVHIPVEIGLALGPKHNFEFALTYYFHPTVEQFSGAVAFGVSFPINSK